MFLNPFIISMSRLTVGSYMPTCPVSTFIVSPGARVYSTISPSRATNATPGPVSFCMMNPSPPKNPAPSFLRKWTSIATVFSAHRNACFWTIIVWPSASGTGTILPGKSDAKATRPLPPWLVNSLRNSDSPVTTRFRMPPMPPPRVLVCITMLPFIHDMPPPSE